MSLATSLALMWFLLFELRGIVSGNKQRDLVGRKFVGQFPAIDPIHHAPR